ncbi:hypothetical protein HK102_007621 [Quaeritorhiza haematococci]|nr:hypothetical protein HK102_007621 [Quaeritorhiza haematococci]
MFLNRCKALEFLRIVEFNQPFRASQLSSILQKPTLGQHLRYLSVGVRGLPREINNLIKALAKRCTNLEILEMTMQVVEPMTAVAPAPPGPQAPAPAAVVGPPAGTATTPPAAARRPARRSKMCPITEETMLLLLKRCPRLRKIMGSKHWKNHRFTDKFLVREMARLVDVRAELDVLKPVHLEILTFLTPEFGQQLKFLSVNCCADLEVLELDMYLTDSTLVAASGDTTKCPVACSSSSADGRASGTRVGGKNWKNRGLRNEFLLSS